MNVTNGVKKVSDVVRKVLDSVKKVSRTQLILVFKLSSALLSYWTLSEIVPSVQPPFSI